MKKKVASPAAGTLRVPHKIALVVTDDDNVEYSASLLSSNYGIAVGTYLARIGGPQWSKLSEQNQVVVVPASTLLELFAHDVVTMAGLHSIVIHNAEKISDHESHPITKLTKCFYHVASPAARPVIFAIGFAPLNVDMLERILGAKALADWKFDAATRMFTERPSEVVIPYESPFTTVDTKLMEQIRELDIDESQYHLEFKSARYALAELGSCACDLTWRRGLQAASPLDHEDDDDPTMTIRNKIRGLVKNWVFAMPNLDITSRGFNVTPKFAQLVQILKSCEAHGEDFRGIVFVQRPEVALVMTEVLRSLVGDLGFLRPFALVGDLPVVDRRYQLDVYQKFLTGKCNLLVVSQSLEDLDIPKALVVICFNLPESQISYAYARARTRGSSSHLIHMVEKGNDAHRRVLSEYTGSIEGDHWAEMVSHNGEYPVPGCALKEATKSLDLDEEEATGVLLDPTTGGRIRVEDASVAVFRLASDLQLASGTSSSQPLLHVREQQDMGVSQTYVCTVTLPPGLPVREVSGPVCLSPCHARRMACFQTCAQLFEIGALDGRFFYLPRSGGGVPVENRVDSTQGDKLSGSRCYVRKRPEFWTNSMQAASHSLYILLISAESSEGPSEPYAPIMLLTHQPLPTLVEFKLFFEGLSSVVHFKQGGRIELDDARLRHLHLYTLRVCRAIANKSFTCPLEKMPYFCAPLKVPHPEAPRWEDLLHFGDLIAWDAVILAGENWAVPLNPDGASGALDVEDAVVQDRWVEFTRRFYAVRLRHDLTPMSKPVDSPREAEYANLVEYCKARRKGFEGLQDYNQPLIEVSKVAGVTNRLNPIFKPVPDSSKASAKYLIPELCAKFTIPASTLRTALLLPSITRRIDDFLIVKELNAKYFDHAICEKLLLAAISAPSAGFEYDYERLELLGDAFLKYLSSLYLFVTNPAQHEGALHTARQRIISNKVLFQSADRASLPQYIQGKPFTYKMWQPPNFIVQSVGAQTEKGAKVPASKPRETEAEHAATSREKTPPDAAKPAKKKKYQEDQVTQWLGDKTVADVVEAIIGAAYLSGGREGALKATKALHVPIPYIEQWDDFRRKALAPPSNVTAKLRESTIKAVEAIIGHRFNHPHLLAQALTHASVQGYEGTCYERLEFVGDAILDFLVVRHVFDRNDQLSPGAMTLLKGAMVSNSALAAVCVWSGLHEHLIFESYSLANGIKVYAEQLKLKQTQEYETAAQEGRSPGQFWLEIEPPKALSDVVESIVGALYISDSFSPVGVEALFAKMLKPFYDRHITLKTLSHHPTKVLFELLQAHGCQHFEIVKEKCENQQGTRCDVIVHDIILANAIDTTGHSAGRKASILALDALEGDSGFMAHTCDCRTGAQARKAQKKVLDRMLADLVNDDGNTGPPEHP
ncbi:hypothetical protein BV22DRAFT_656663 [Leucogyrophana mollusca]|uniref:Uncharacterized protein n=1 Tax=Leucogyrophana mollusca TaxID=85980 RepID=A0ACB8BA33_9AGAM|nr:hypothetical protein BV22DRAFT_656663 [Leucogyrophana mollusca]